MARILFDQNVPVSLRQRLDDGNEISTAFEMGWSEFQNGELILAAEANGFDVFLSCDQSIRYQQNLAGRTIAIVVLMTNHRKTIIERASSVVQAIGDARRGSDREILGPTER